MDLSKFAEVKTLTSDPSHKVDYFDRAVNAWLLQGWQVISSKIVEAQWRVSGGIPEHSYVAKGPQVVYILGKPRGNKSRPTASDDCNQR